jgi:sugar lactone lactonase YvrE
MVARAPEERPAANRAAADAPVNTPAHTPSPTPPPQKPTGMLRVPIPYPATRENYIELVPPHVLPWTWRPILPAAAAALRDDSGVVDDDDASGGNDNATATTTSSHPPSAFVANTRLRDSAVRLFKGRVFGSESVTFDPTDPSGARLVMLDAYGAVWEAKHDPRGGGGSSSGHSAPGAKAARAAKRLVSSLVRGNHPWEEDPPTEDDFELSPEPVAWLGAGRPLGAAFLPTTGELLVCDALKGLLSLAPRARRPTLLANHVSASSSLDPGTPIRYCNDVAVSADGSIVYLTDSVDMTIQRMRLGHGAETPSKGVAGAPPGSGAFAYDTKTGWAVGFVQARAAGRLLAYDVATGQVRVLAKGFRYANGVALPRGEAFVAVVETDRLRVVRVPLRRPTAEEAREPPLLETEGHHPALVADGIELAPDLVSRLSGEGAAERPAAHPTVLIQHLPAAPDGLATAAGGKAFWLSLVVGIPPVAKRFRPAAFRALVAWLPRTLRPKPVRWGGVARVDAVTGRVQQFLNDPTGGRVATVSAAHEHGGRLYFGNLDLDYVAVARVPREPAAGQGYWEVEGEGQAEAEAPAAAAA